MGIARYGDSQCPTCGGAVMSDDISKSTIPLIHCIILALVGAAASVAALATLITYYPGVKQRIALYVMNHWV